MAKNKFDPVKAKKKRGFASSFGKDGELILIGIFFGLMFLSAVAQWVGSDVQTALKIENEHLQNQSLLFSTKMKKSIERS